MHGTLHHNSIETKVTSMPVRIVLIGLLLLHSVFSFAQTPQPAAPTFTVTRYEVVGDNPLSYSETQDVVKPYEGEHEGLEGLQSAADALEHILRAKGYSFHRVVLPPQTLRDGVVRLQVVEFPLGEVIIEGNRYFTRANILRSLPGLKENKSPNLNRLARSLRLANQHPAKQVTLGFKESEKAQAVDARLKVEDRSPHSVFTVLQNTGSEDTGDYRLTLGYQYSNLFDRDHSVSILYTTAPDDTNAVTQYGVSYRIPLYSISSAFSFSYSDSDIESGLIDTGQTVSGDDTRFFSLTGKGTAATLGYTYQFPGSSRYQHELKLSYEDKLFENGLIFGGVEQPTNATTECIASDGRVRTNPLGVTYRAVARGEKSAVGYSLGFYSNQAGGSYSDDLAYDCVRTGAISDWSATRYAFNYDQRLGGDWVFSFRLQGQSTGEILVAGEQIGLGGATSIRGYEERSILGDEGWYGSLELWTPAFANDSMNALLFYDLGHAEATLNSPEVRDESTNEIIAEATSVLTEIDPAGAGIGLRWNWNKKLDMRLYVAMALEDYDSSGSTGDSTTNPNDGIDIKAGDTTVHFSLYYRF